VGAEADTMPLSAKTPDAGIHLSRHFMAPLVVGIVTRTRLSGAEFDISDLLFIGQSAILVQERYI
jgi:hypothetical protein